jgi:hypothetical protein
MSSLQGRFSNVAASSAARFGEQRILKDPDSNLPFNLVDDEGNEEIKQSDSSPRCVASGSNKEASRRRAIARPVPQPARVASGGVRGRGDARRVVAELPRQSLAEH